MIISYSPQGPTCSCFLEKYGEYNYQNCSDTCGPKVKYLDQHVEVEKTACRNSNIKHFDFGRSTYQEGTYRFKKQWGAEPQLLAWQKFTPQGQIIMQAQGEGSSGKLRELIENTWRKLPLGLTIKVGATVRPYISL